MNIGIVVIATNKYIDFAKPLIESIDKYFMVLHSRKIFLITDHTEFSCDAKVTIIPQEHQPWPKMTLLRYEMIYKNSEYFKDIDVLYYIDADMRVNDYVDNDFLPGDRDLVAVLHPGYFVKRIQTFERNPLSTAYVPLTGHHTYYHGAIQGGKKEPYLNMCKELSENINKDLLNDYIAIWWDESHWNKYLIDHPKSFKQMTPSYSYPEKWNLPFAKKILALDKDHTEIRKDKVSDYWNKNMCDTMMPQFVEWVKDYTAESKVYIRNLVKDAGYKTVLDVAAGLCDQYHGYKVDGIDVEYTAMDNCKYFIDKAKEQNIPIIDASIHSDVQVPDNTYDIVTARHIIEHLPNFRLGIDQMIRMAKQQVVIIFFIKPTDSEKIRYTENNDMYHNIYKRQDIDNYLDAKCTVSHNWEDINDTEIALIIRK
jgi:histo-blood group ABO system transferase